MESRGNILHFSCFPVAPIFADACLRIQQEWHSIRAQMEHAMETADKGAKVDRGERGKYLPDTFHGHCRAHGDYVPMHVVHHEEKMAQVLWDVKS